MRQISLLGHRGARGLLAENTLPSLAKPFEYGADGIEFDLQLSKDNQLVIYHDLRLKSNITRDSNGKWIKKIGPPIRSLTLKQLKQYKLGQINKKTPYGLKFRKQDALPDQTIPTLDELIEHFDKLNLNSKILNIEIKHSPQQPDLCPKPTTLARKVIDEIYRLKIADRCVLSCFNWAVIKAVRQIDSKLKIGCLTMIDMAEDTISPVKGKTSLWNAGLDIRDHENSVAKMVTEFGAEYWIPYYKNLTRKELNQAHLHKLSVMTWTVNHHRTMMKLMNWGIDGIITDYPDKLGNMWRRFNTKK